MRLILAIVAVCFVLSPVRADETDKRLKELESRVKKIEDTIDWKTTKKVATSVKCACTGGDVCVCPKNKACPCNKVATKHPAAGTVLSEKPATLAEANTPVFQAPSFQLPPQGWSNQPFGQMRCGPRGCSPARRR